VRGYQLTFFTQQNRTHGGRPLGEWLLEEALRLGVSGATLNAATEGYGHHHRIHSARFFELADQPIELTMAVTAEEADRVFERLTQEHISVFYVKAPVEFGTTGET
jgi:PII-like signaling protein